MIQRRDDCEDFEPKPYPHSCGRCQTDGHYLCIGCKHIASFEDMEVSDNRLTYYYKLEQERIKLQELQEQERMKDMESN